MSTPDDDYEPSAGLLPAIAGVVCLVLGGLMLEDSHGSDTFVAGGLALLGAGLYLVVLGAVARGVQLSRR